MQTELSQYEEVELDPDPDTMRRIERLRRKRKVCLVRNGSFVDIVPECTDMFRDFYTKKHVAATDSAHGTSIRRVAAPLVWRDKDWDTDVPITRANAGLWPLIVQRIEERGLKVLKVEKAAPPLPSRSGLVMLVTDGMDSEVDDAMLQMMQRHDMGVIRYDASHVDPVRLVAQTALAWPKWRMIVLVTRRADAWDIRKRLCEQYRLRKRDVPVFAGGGTLEKPGPVRITTYACAAQAGVGGYTSSIVLALNPTEMLTNEWADWGMQVMQKARIYAMLPFAKHLTAWERDWIHARFGFSEIRIPEHGMVEWPVNVVFCPMHGGPKLPRNAGLAEVLRAGIWQHPVRNRRIAAMAKAVASGDSERIRRQFDAEFPRTVARQRRRTGVLVANVDHALELSRRLPDWPIIAAEEYTAEGLTAEQDEQVRRGNSDTARKCRSVIVTTAGLARAGRLDVLIRADAGIGLRLTSRYDYHNVNAKYPVLIVDFVDKHHPELLARTKRRKTAYWHAGWNFVDDNRTQLQKFIAQRPKVDKQ